MGPQKIFLGKTLRKIIKIVATRLRIWRLKCTKFDVGWGSAPDLAGGSLQRSPRPPSWIWGPLRGRQGGGAGLGKRRERGGESGGREREGPKLLLNQGPSQPCYATDSEAPPNSLTTIVRMNNGRLWSWQLEVESEVTFSENNSIAKFISWDYYYHYYYKKKN